MSQIGGSQVGATALITGHAVLTKVPLVDVHCTPQCDEAANDGFSSMPTVVTELREVVNRFAPSVGAIGAARNGPEWLNVEQEP